MRICTRVVNVSGSKGADDMFWEITVVRQQWMPAYW